MSRTCVICGKPLTTKRQKYTCGSYECHKARMREVKRLRKAGKDVSELGNFDSRYTRQEEIIRDIHILLDDSLSAQEKGRRLNIDTLHSMRYYFYRYKAKYTQLPEYAKYKNSKLRISLTDTDSPIYKAYVLEQERKKSKRKITKRAKPKFEDHKARQLLDKMKRGEL